MLLFLLFKLNRYIDDEKIQNKYILYIICIFFNKDLLSRIRINKKAFFLNNICHFLLINGLTSILYITPVLTKVQPNICVLGKQTTNKDIILINVHLNNTYVFNLIIILCT